MVHEAVFLFVLGAAGSFQKKYLAILACLKANFSAVCEVASFRFLVQSASNRIFPSFGFNLHSDNIHVGNTVFPDIRQGLANW